MSTHSESKLNQMLGMQPSGTVYLTQTLERAGISKDLQKKYRDHGWLESIGYGAMKRPGDSIRWQGAVYSLQQAGVDVHIGGRSALIRQGYGHYVALGREEVQLFSAGPVKLPGWFLHYDWGVDIRHFQTTFLPADLGVISQEERDYSVRVSSLVRAMMECLYLVPGKFDFIEAAQLMDSLRGLVPGEVERLLAASSSIKVNRIFLFLAHRSGHAWLKYLPIDKVSLGKGKRQIVKEGVLDSRFEITVPPELAG